ncbi:hypothetical protein [Streptomyces sp. NPDC127038]|uniref:hypothetical protein n=1 Tax=Streptomyces sp. NPDC127038 TaxID=3347114 RepID=UPI003665F299
MQICRTDRVASDPDPATTAAGRTNGRGKDGQGKDGQWYAVTPSGGRSGLSG